MTIELRPPHSGEEASLRALFTQAFGDEAFTELFFRTAYAPQRCRVASDGTVLAALYWFACTLDGRQIAYLYAIATGPAHRGRGIGSRLIENTLAHLKTLGYAAAMLVPAEPGLFPFYEKLGFATVSTICEETVTAAPPIPVRKLAAREYAQLRRAYLPKNSVLQEGPCLDLLAGYADFYEGAGALCAVSGQMVWELLGSPTAAPGILGALQIPAAAVRTPGAGRPFAMAHGLTEPVYFGLALD